MHNADWRYSCHTLGYEKRIETGWLKELKNTQPVFVCGHLLWDKVFSHRIMYYFLKVKQCQPSTVISTCMVDSIMPYTGVSSEWKLCLSIFEAMTWVRLTLFLQAKWFYINRKAQAAHEGTCPCFNEKQQFQIPVKELDNSLPYFSILQGKVTHRVEVVGGVLCFFFFF